MKRISAISSALTLGFAMTLLTLLILLILLIASIHSAPATERLIPGDYGTIQSAIDAADDGDVITINPGIYVEHINFLSLISASAFLI